MTKLTQSLPALVLLLSSACATPRVKFDKRIASNQHLRRIAILMIGESQDFRVEVQHVTTIQNLVEVDTTVKNSNEFISRLNGGDVLLKSASGSGSAGPVGSSAVLHPGVVLAPGAEVRTAPYLVSPLLLNLRAGDLLSLSDRVNDGWRRVQIPDGRTGYVQDTQVRIEARASPPRGSADVAASPSASTNPQSATSATPPIKFGPALVMALQKQLQENGYRVQYLANEGPKTASDGKTATYSHIQTDADAILHVWFGTQGYVKTMHWGSVYQPWLIVSARLIDVRTKAVVYFQTYSVYPQKAGGSLDDWEHIEADDRYKYDSFESLMAKFDEATEGIMHSERIVAARIAQQLSLR